MSVNFSLRKCKGTYISIPLVVNGLTYNYPELGDEGWGSDAERWALGVTQSALFKNGGLFSLTGEVDFGPSFGLKSIYYKSRTANIAASGQIRLANSDTIAFRNNANTGDIALGINASDQPTWNGVSLGAGGTNGQLQFNNNGALGGITANSGFVNVIFDNGLSNNIYFGYGSGVGPGGNGLYIIPNGLNAGLGGVGTISFYDHLGNQSVGQISCEGGGQQINIGASGKVFISTPNIQFQALTTLISGATSLSFTGSSLINLNDGSGSGAGVLNLDSATINVDGTHTGASGTFTATGKTVTVINGIITSIV